jgi:hypothetical protein
MDCLLALFAVASDHQKVPQKDLLEPVAPSSFIFMRRKTSLGPT